VEIIELGSAPVIKSSSQSSVARAAIEAAGEVYGEPPVVYPLNPASGPVGAVCGASEPPMAVVSFGTSYAGSNPHGPDENIRLEDFLQNIKFFGRVIHHLGQQARHSKGGNQKSSTALVLSKG
jgi:acetylornithine deacetylase/succinyl-diaminopimelate desuccinylase-like protein